MTEQIWIKHEDGKAAYIIDKNHQVVVRLRSAEVLSGKVKDFRWDIDGNEDDIVEWFPVGNPVGLHPPILLKNAPASAAQPTGVEKQLCDMIAARQQAGIRKYGTTLAGNPLPLRAWLQHQLEELLDASAYVQRAINEIDAKADDGK